MPPKPEQSWLNINNPAIPQNPGSSTSADLEGTQTSQEVPSRPAPPVRTDTASSTSLQLPNTSDHSQQAQRSQSSPPLAYLRVQVLRATNLTPKDRNGKADPYAVVSLPGLAALSSKTNNNSDRYRKKTATISKNLEPEWKNEVWDFPITHEWFGPEGFTEQEEEGEIAQAVDAILSDHDGVVDTTDSLALIHVEDDGGEDRSIASTDAKSGSVTPAIAVTTTTASDKAVRPPGTRRVLSSAAIKVLSSSAKGVKLLPKGAAAGARAIVRATPRPTYLRRVTGTRRIPSTSISLASNLEVVLWDQDWGGRREYMGEANWPVWEWIRAPRKVEWADDVKEAASQSTWLNLVSSRQSKTVSGRIQLRVGLVQASDSPVKSLDRLYRALVAAAVGTTRNVTTTDVTARRPRPHSISAETEDQIRAGVRAIPAAQSVGTGGDFFEDDGLPSDDEEQELLDSDSDSADDSSTSEEDDDLESDSATDGPLSTDDDFTGPEGEEDPLAKHKARLKSSSFIRHPSSAVEYPSSAPSGSQSPVPSQISTQSATGSVDEDMVPSRRKLLGALSRKAGFRSTGHSSGRATPATVDDSHDSVLGQVPKKTRRRRLRVRKRGKSGTNDAGVEGESKEGRSLRKRLAREARREAKQKRRLEQQEYSFRSGGDVKGIVMMEISGAIDLPRWRNSLRTTFDMDPFTIVAFGHKVFRTRVLRHTLNPTWNEKLLFHVRKGEENFDIKLSIYDWDKITANDHVGSCTLSLATLLEAAPKANDQTGLFDAAASVDSELQTFKLPLKRYEKDEEVKFGHTTPILTVRAKYTPYAALRQRFWRQLLAQFDTNDSQSVSTLELTSMLDSLGSTLTTETIYSFFTNIGKVPEEDELTFDEAIVALETEISRPLTQKKVRRDTNEDFGRHTPGTSGPGESDARQAETGLDLRGPQAPLPDESGREKTSSPPVIPIPASSRLTPMGSESDDSMLRPVSASTRTSYTQEMLSKSPEETFSSKPPTRPSPSPCGSSRPSFLSKHTSSTSNSSPSRSQSSTDVLHLASANSRSNSTPEPGRDYDGQGANGDRVVERVAVLKTCPLCHMPRLNRKGDGDVITHLAVCAAQDWRRVDSLVVRNFVTASQAHRKFVNKLLINATQGAYKLGANSANLIVQDRQTGELLEEKMQIYVRLGIRLLYQGARSRMEGARVRKMLKNMSVKQGRKYDSPASAKEIPGFIAFHNLNVDEILDPLDSFNTFNQFFYRKLKPNARPIDEPENPKRLVSAADCRMMAFDSIDAATTIWIKGREFSVERLLGDEFKGKVEGFKNGSLCIFRLAPQDYHRFHCPADAVVGEPVWIEGQYYTVNCMAIRSTIDIYGENVRVVVPFHSEAFGTFYAINIGAMMVGSIVLTVKAGQKVKKGDEMGYYAFGGSTTVCIFEKGKVEFDEDILTNSRACIETLVKQGVGIGRAVEDDESEREGKDGSS